MIVHLYEVNRRHFCLLRGKMADFYPLLDGSARLFFIHNVKIVESYRSKKSMMLADYNFDTRQLQIDSQLQKLLLRNLMVEETITDD